MNTQLTIPTNTNYYKTLPSGFDLSKRDFTGGLFDKADLTDMDLSECKLTRCTFRRAILVRTNFCNAFVEEPDELRKRARVEERLKLGKTAQRYQSVAWDRNARIKALLAQALVIEEVILPDGSMLTCSSEQP